MITLDVKYHEMIGDMHKKKVNDIMNGMKTKESTNEESNNMTTTLATKQPHTTSLTKDSPKSPKDKKSILTKPSLSNPNSQPNTSTKTTPRSKSYIPGQTKPLSNTISSTPKPTSNENSEKKNIEKSITRKPRVTPFKKPPTAKLLNSINEGSNGKNQTLTPDLEKASARNLKKRINDSSVVKKPIDKHVRTKSYTSKPITTTKEKKPSNGSLDTPKNQNKYNSNTKVESENKKPITGYSYRGNSGTKDSMGKVNSNAYGSKPLEKRSTTPTTNSGILKHGGGDKVSNQTNLKQNDKMDSDRAGSVLNKSN